MKKSDLEARLRRKAGADPILRQVRQVGRETGVAVWLVGGAVRDALAGRRFRDVDLVAGPGARTLIARLESLWDRRGFRFRKRGVTTWRFDRGERGVDVVDAGRRGIEADLRRRELTVNAIAFDLAGGGILDPLGGARDLRSGLLRLPREGVVSEDPVRALRLARFLAEFPAFRLHPDARRAAVHAARPLSRAPVERVREELDKLLCAGAPGRGLEALGSLGLLGSVLPELSALPSCAAGKGRPDVWRHTGDAITASATRRALPGGPILRDPEGRRLVRWALLLHDISKPETIRRAHGRPTFHGHEVVGARRADSLLKRLRFPRDLRKRVVRLVLFHLRPHHLADSGAPERGLRRLVRDSGPDLPCLVAHAACDALASGAPDAAARWRRLRPVLVRLLAMHEESLSAPRPPLVHGRDVMEALGIGPGPEVGAALREVRELQEENLLRTREEAVAYLRVRAGAKPDRRTDRA